MAFFTQFEEKTKKFNVDSSDKQRISDCIQELEKAVSSVDEFESKLSNLGSNSQISRLGDTIKEVHTAFGLLANKTNDLNTMEHSVGNISNALDKLKAAASNSMNFISPEETQVVSSFISQLQSASEQIEQFGSKTNITRLNLKDMLNDINSMGRMEIGESLNSGLDQMGQKIASLSTNLASFSAQSKNLNMDEVFGSSVKSLESTITGIQTHMKTIGQLQTELNQLQKNPEVGSNDQKISVVSDKIAAEASAIQDVLKKVTGDVQTFQEVCKGSNLEGFAAKIAEDFSKLGNALPEELIQKVKSLSSAFSDAYTNVNSGAWDSGSEQAIRSFETLNNMIRGVIDTSKQAQAATAGIGETTKHSVDTLATDFVMLAQNSAAFNTINDSIKNVTKSLEESTESANKLAQSIDPSKLQNSGIGGLHKDLTTLHTLMAELKAANDQEGLVFTNPTEYRKKRNDAAKLQEDIALRYSHVMNHGQDFENQDALVSLKDGIQGSFKEFSKIDRLFSENLRSEGASGHFKKELDQNITLSEVVQGESSRLFRKNETANVQKIEEQINSIINNNPSSLSQLMEMAGGHRAGTIYESNMHKATTGAYNLSHKASNLKSELNRDDSKYSEDQKRTMNSVFNMDEITKQSQELSKLMATFNEMKGDLFKDIQHYTKTGQGDENVIRSKARVLGNLQTKIAGQTSEMTRGVNIGAIDKDTFKNMGKDGEAFLKAIQEQAETIQKATDYYAEFAKKVTDPSQLTELNKLKRELEEVGEKIDANSKKTNDWKGGFASLFSKTLSGLGGLARGVGLGALAGGIGSLFAKAPEHWNQIGRATANTAMVDYGMGADFNAAAAQDRIFAQGQKFHALSNGMIGFEELNNRYNSMARNVGGGYGKSPTEGAADLNEINKETFALSKVYNVGEGVMNESVKAFYKDLGMSASEATYTIHNLAQTAVASNIPVEKYLQMVSGLAQQYKNIGLDGRDAINVMQNAIHQGATAEQAQKMTSQLGNAVSNFAENDSEVGFYGMLSGQFHDPFDAMAAARHRMDKNFNPVDGWQDTMTGMIDAKLKMYGAIGEGHEGMQSWLVNKQMRQMGLSSDMASAATDKYLTDKEGFSSWFKENEKKLMGSKEDSVAEANKKLEEQIANASGHLSQADKTMALLDRQMRQLGMTIGPSIDNAIKPLTNALNKAMDMINGAVEKLIKAPIWNKITENLGTATVALIGVAVGAKILGGTISALKAVFSPIAGLLTSIVGFLGGKGKAATIPKKGRIGIGIAAGVATAYGASKLWDYFTTPSKAEASPLRPELDSSAFKQAADPSKFTSSQKEIYNAYREYGYSKAEAAQLATSGGYDFDNPEQPAKQTKQVKTIAKQDDGSSIVDTTLSGIGAGFDMWSMKGITNTLIKGATAMANKGWIKPSTFAKLPVAGAGGVLSAAVDNGMEYLGHQVMGDSVAGDKGKWLANTIVDGGWTALGASVGGFFGGPVGAAAGGYLTKTAGEYVNKWTADENGRGWNDRAKDWLTEKFTGTDSAGLERERAALYGSGDEESETMRIATAGANMDEINESVRQAKATEPQISSDNQELMTMVQGLGSGVATQEELETLLNPDTSAQKHGEVIEKLNQKLAEQSHMSRKELADRQSYQWATLSDSEKAKMQEIEASVRDGSALTKDKLDELIKTVQNSKFGSVGMQGIGDKAYNQVPAEYKGMVDDVSKRTGVPASAIAAMMQIESSFSQDAIGRDEDNNPLAYGLMQLSPDKAGKYGINIHDSYQNIYGGALEMQNLFSKYGDWRVVAAAYNGGEGFADRMIDESGSKNWDDISAHIHKTYPSTSMDSWDVQTRGHVQKFIDAAGGINAVPPAMKPTTQNVAKVAEESATIKALKDTIDSLKERLDKLTPQGSGGSGSGSYSGDKPKTDSNKASKKSNPKQEKYDAFMNGLQTTYNGGKRVDWVQNGGARINGQVLARTIARSLNPKAIQNGIIDNNGKPIIVDAWKKIQDQELRKKTPGPRTFKDYSSLYEASKNNPPPSSKVEVSIDAKLRNEIKGDDFDTRMERAINAFKKELDIDGSANVRINKIENKLVNVQEQIADFHYQSKNFS